jgi:hypothetical protein
MTDHYLNPVVPQNFTNAGTLGNFSADYERDLTPKDRLRFIVRHEFSRYDIPNELVQQTNGQIQTADNIETMGIASYQHTFSSNALADFRTMVRDNEIGFNSNAESDPIAVFQQIPFAKHTSRELQPSPAVETNGNLALSPTTSFSTRTFATTLPIRPNLTRPLHPTSVSSRIGRTSSNPFSCRTRFV